jgi:MFS family permease
MTGGSAVTKQKKHLMWMIMLIAIIQMPNLAILPSIHRITLLFPEKTVAAVQTAVSLPNLISPLVALLVSQLVYYITKKRAILIGLALLFAVGVLCFAFNTAFWHIIFLSCVMGTALGFFVPTTTSVMFDNFTESETQKLTGYQTSFLNGGGIIMSLAGGALATYIWYGGYTVLVLALPVLILCWKFIPQDEAMYRSGPKKAGERKSRLHGDIFYYAVIVLLFQLLNAVSGSNISLHVAQGGVGDSSVAGIASALQMAGGVFSGIFFGRLSARFKDMLVPISFAILAVGFVVISVFQTSLPLILFGCFILGTAMSVIMPQCLYDISRKVDASSSTMATTLVMAVAPSIGAFISPSVFTNITTAIAGDSTKFRYMFVAVTALAASVVLTVLTARRGKKDALPEADG